MTLSDASPTDDGSLVAAGELLPVTITDTRKPETQEWTVSAQVGEFSNGTTTVGGQHLGWTPKVVTAGAGAVAGDQVRPGTDEGTGLAHSAVLGSAPGGHQTGSATLGANLTLKLPGDTEPGLYSATLTLTALS